MSTTEVTNKLATQIKQFVLHAREDGGDRLGHGIGEQNANCAVQLIDAAVGFYSVTGFVHSRAITQAS